MKKELLRNSRRPIEIDQKSDERGRKECSKYLGLKGLRGVQSLWGMKLQWHQMDNKILSRMSLLVGSTAHMTMTRKNRKVNVALGKVDTKVFKRIRKGM